VPGVGARPLPSQLLVGEDAGGVQETFSLLSKREETMKARSLRESGLRWLSHAPGSLRSLWNTPGKSFRKSEAKAVWHIGAVDGRMAAHSTRHRGGILLAP
jgi:hypothetical protein